LSAVYIDQALAGVGSVSNHANALVFFAPLRLGCSEFGDLASRR